MHGGGGSIVSARLVSGAAITIAIGHVSKRILQLDTHRSLFRSSWSLDARGLRLVDSAHAQEGEREKEDRTMSHHRSVHLVSNDALVSFKLGASLLGDLAVSL